jgi:hypothetical protein
MALYECVDDFNQCLHLSLTKPVTMHNTITVFARIPPTASIFSNDNKCSFNAYAASIRGQL